MKEGEELILKVHSVKILGDIASNVKSKSFFLLSLVPCGKKSCIQVVNGHKVSLFSLCGRFTRGSVLLQLQAYR